MRNASHGRPSRLTTPIVVPAPVSTPHAAQNSQIHSGAEVLTRPRGNDGIFYDRAERTYVAARRILTLFYEQHERGHDRRTPGGLRATSPWSRTAASRYDLALFQTGIVEDGRRHRTNGKTTTTFLIKHISGAGCRRSHRPLQIGEAFCRPAHDAGVARPSGIARPDGQRRLQSGGEEVSSHARAERTRGRMGRGFSNSDLTISIFIRCELLSRVPSLHY